MSIEELTAAALALPLPERVELAQALWASIDDDDKPIKWEKEWEEEAARRAEEMRTGKVRGLTHEEVFRSVRRALGQE